MLLFVDKGYRGHNNKSAKVFISGQRKGVTTTIKKQLKRRQAIEPYIGHMKNEGKLGLCRLKGISGDQINAVLVAASYNLKLVLNHLRELLVNFIYHVFIIQISKLNCINLCIHTESKL